MRHRPRKDANHNAIAAALTAAGCKVYDTSALGGGFPDMVVCRAGVTYVFEVKSGPGSMTPAQVDFVAGWRGGPMSVVRSEDEALRIVGALRHKSMFATKPI